MQIEIMNSDWFKANILVSFRVKCKRGCITLCREYFLVWVTLSRHEGNFHNFIFPTNERCIASDRQLIPRTHESCSLLIVNSFFELSFSFSFFLFACCYQLTAFAALSASFIFQRLMYLQSTVQQQIPFNRSISAFDLRPLWIARHQLGACLGRNNGKND